MDEIAADLVVFLFFRERPFAPPSRQQQQRALYIYIRHRRKNWENKWILQAALVPNGPLNGVKNCQTLFKGYFEAVMYGPGIRAFLV